MANTTIGGFRVWGTTYGGEGDIPNSWVQEVANNYASALAVGDIIIGVSDGTVAKGAAANNGLLLGCVQGISYVQTGRRILSNYLPANTTFTSPAVGSANASLVRFVPLTPDVILEVDGNAAAPTPTLAGVIGLIQENCDLDATGTADSTTGVSAMCLDLSTHATTTANFRIVGVQGYSLTGGLHLLTAAGPNDPTASRFKFLVTCNEGLLPPYTATGV